MSSFGIFDGHMGAAAAEACASQLHSMVTQNCNSLNRANGFKSQHNSAREEQPPQPPPQPTTEDQALSELDQSRKSDSHPAAPATAESADCVLKKPSQSDIRDGIVCESIGRACTELDTEIRRYSNAGSTVVSLFMLWEGDDPQNLSQFNGGPANKLNSRVRVYCANMGDSRCVMLRAYDTREALNMPSNFDPNVRTESDYQAKTPTMSQKLEGSDVAMVEASSSRFVAVHMMSEDHKLQLVRERRRILSLSAPAWYSLPCDASPIFMPGYARTAPPVGCPPLPPLDGAPPSTEAGNFAIVNSLPPIKTSTSRALSSHGTGGGVSSDRRARTPCSRSSRAVRGRSTGPVSTARGGPHWAGWRARCMARWGCLSTT